jgi:mono/diheme cytochrome c family protein
LLFVGRNDGRLTALNSDTGMKLWEFQTGAGMNSTVSTFERDGKQYVVAYSAGNVLAGSPKGDSVWLFALGGTLPPANEHDAQPAPVVAAPAAVAANALGSTGADIYRQACLPCHGPDGKGGHGGGAPLEKAKDLASVVLTIREGRKNMPPFGAALTAEQIQAVGAFVVEGHFNP